jgi:hypothetical protein
MPMENPVPASTMSLCQLATNIRLRYDRVPCTEIAVSPWLFPA